MQEVRFPPPQDELLLLCGHYEGIDERVLEEVVTDYISIGDYVLTGGELAAMVIVDAVARLVPGVLGNEQSALTESFHGELLEHPQYSRPDVWHGKKVPPAEFKEAYEKMKLGDHSVVYEHGSSSAHIPLYSPEPVQDIPPVPRFPSDFRKQERQAVPR